MPPAADGGGGVWSRLDGGDEQGRGDEDEEDEFPVQCEPEHRADQARGLIELGPGAGHQHTATVVVLHGFGETAADWFEPCAWLAQRLPHARFVLPTGGVTTDTHGTAAQWYELGRGPTAATAAPVAALIDAAARAVGAARVVVAGFSQGGQMALHAALRRAAAPVAGVLALSTHLPPRPAVAAAAAATRVLLCHGERDELIPVRMARAAHAFLRDRGVAEAELRVYPSLGHVRGVAVPGGAAEMADILEWLRRVVPGAGPAAGARRVAPDGGAYTKPEFVDFFGGTAEWDAARAVKQRWAGWETWSPTPRL